MVERPAARLGIDTHTCPTPQHVGGPLDPMMGPSNVFIEDFPAAKALDMATCALPPKNQIIMGSPNVFINDQHAARMGDLMFHGGVIASGAATVGIGVPGDGIQIKPVTTGIVPVPSSGSQSESNEKDSQEILANKKEAKFDSSIDVAPICSFELFDLESDHKVKIGGQGSYDALVRGRKYRAESRSYDPDDGDGTLWDKGITRWQWRVDFIGLPGITPTESSENFIIFTVPSLIDDREEKVESVILHLSVTDNDDIPKSDNARRTIAVRTASNCQNNAERVKEVKKELDQIYSRLKDMGHDNAAKAYAKWLTGEGGELVYDSKWFREQIQDAEQRINRAILRQLKSLLVGLPQGRHRLRSEATETAVSFLKPDFYTSWGKCTIHAVARLVFTVFPNGAISGLITISYEGRDRYNWNPGANVPAPNISTGFMWKDDDSLLLEDCHSPKPRPFDNRARWTEMGALTGLSLMGARLNNSGSIFTEEDNRIIINVSKLDLGLNNSYNQY